MKSILTTLVLGSMTLALSGAIVGCSDDTTTVRTTRTDTVRGTDSSYKKTEVRDANGNLVEKKVESKTTN